MTLLSKKFKIVCTRMAKRNEVVTSSGLPISQTGGAFLEFYLKRFIAAIMRKKYAIEHMGSEQSCLQARKF